MLRQCLFLLFLSLFSHSSLAKKNDDDFIVAGYLPNYRFDDYNTTAAAPYLTDIFLFSIEANKYGLISTCCLEERHYRVGDSRIRRWVTVGGAGRSHGFAAIAASPQKQANFLQRLVDLCLQHGLVGVDFNWEQPTSQAEFQAYMAMLLEACKLLHSQKLLVSLSTRLHIIPQQVVEELDYVLVNTYQMPGHAYHAEYSVVTKHVEEHWLQKIPRHKLLLGIPAYSALGSDTKTYKELMEDAMKSHPNRNDWDDFEEYKSYLFESPHSVRKKVAYAQSKGMGGVFFWELGQDLQVPGYSGGMLLEAASQQANERREDKEQEL